jgi:hypothetical protein
MKEDFFDWLEDCPVQWFLKDDDENGRTYLFIDNDDEEEETENDKDEKEQTEWEKISDKEATTVYRI